MKKILLIWLLLGGLVSLAVVGCAPAQADPAPDAVVVVQADPVAEQTAEPAAPAAEAVTAVTLPATPLPAQDTECIDCHSDAELLQTVAEPEPERVSLNEGSG